MKYSKIVLLSLSGLFILNSYCQLSVIVKDATTKQPLPFTTIECIPQHWGLYTDSSGMASITDSIWKTGMLEISYTGYTTKTLQLTNSIHEILLVKMEKKLIDIKVIPCKAYEQTSIGIQKKKSHFGFSQPVKNSGYMWATFIPNNTGKRGYIHTISFGAKGMEKGENVHAPVRLRFYEMDTITRLPTTEITNENIVIVPRKLGWQTEDLSIYNIFFQKKEL